MQIYLSENQKRALEEQSDKTGKSIAELIRNAVDRQLQQSKRESFKEILRSSFNTWKNPQKEEQNVRKLREEWKERNRSGT